MMAIVCFCQDAWGQSFGDACSSATISRIFVADKKQKTFRTDVSSSDLRSLEKAVNELAKQHIPHKYFREKDWGRQRERWDGLHVQVKNFQLKTKRRKKMVNHGTWKKYSAELANPVEGFQFQLKSIRKNERNDVLVRLSVSANLKLFGRMAEWFKGVQLFSLSVEGSARVQLDLTLKLNTRLDFSKLPPDLYLNPVVCRADLDVHEFQIRRISKIGGEVAQQISRSVREVLDDKIKEYETKLVVKMNKSISKKQNDLKLSVVELVESEWSSLQEYLVPDDLDAKKVAK